MMLFNMWMKKLSYDPIESLIRTDNPSIQYFTKRDLLNENVVEVDCLWDMKLPKKLIKSQQEDGSWKYPGAQLKLRSRENYNQLETFRQLGELVEKYGFNKTHPTIQKAAEYLFSCQTEEGDFRGIYGNQYATTYTGAIIEILIKAGYVSDPRIEKGFQWLISIRQKDGGWAIPLRTVNMKYVDALMHPELLQGDTTKPFSHLITGIVLRAFASHPNYRNAPEARHAGKLLISRFFKRDKYNDRREKKYWEAVSFPFWFTDIVTSLDSLYFLGFKREEPEIQSALNWLAGRQIADGTFKLKLLREHDKDLKYWITLVICRIFKRYYNKKNTNR
jgi:Squalene-hopene cyclase C-terminal domain